MLRLCEEYKDRGVVGIDLAGDEGSSSESRSTLLYWSNFLFILQPVGLLGMTSKTLCLYWSLFSSLGYTGTEKISDLLIH